jgi:outer membrane protein
MKNMFPRCLHNYPVPLSLMLLAAGACGAVVAAEPDSASGGGSLVVAAGAAVGPRYSGSQQNAVGPALLLDYDTASGLFVSTMRGLGYGGQAGRFSYSAALGFRGARKEKDQTAFLGNSGSDRLQGMGEIKGNASAILGVSYTPLSGYSLGVSADLPLSQKDNGKNLHVSASGLLYGQGNERLSLGLTVGFADSNYAQTYYGVTAAQAAHSRFHAYQAGSGLYEVSAMLTWDHKFDKHWGMTSMLGATALMKDASRSPLSERKTSPTAAVMATYKY